MHTDYKIDRFSNTSGSSFERARSVSRSRGQTAEERAFAEMKKMLASYEALTERLMTENASLAGRVTALETSLEQTQKMHKETFDAYTEELTDLKEELNNEKTVRIELKEQLGQTKKDLQKTREEGWDLNHQFVIHHHDRYYNCTETPFLPKDSQGFK